AIAVGTSFSFLSLIHIPQSLPGQLNPARGMLRRNLYPFLHRATTHWIKQVSARKLQCLAMLRASKFENHCTIVETGECFAALILFQARHTKHFSAFDRRRRHKLSDDLVIQTTWISGHSTVLPIVYRCSPSHKFRSLTSLSL